MIGRLKWKLRLFVGWCIAWGYVLVGKRRRCVRRYDEEGTILSFVAHGPDPRMFEGVLAWLARQGFTFVSTEDVLEMRAGRRAWRPRLAWLSLDDGWASVKGILPLLERYGCPVTIFVPPAEVARGHVWTNAVMPYERDWRSFYFLPAEERYRRVDAVLGGEKAQPPGVGRELMSAEELREMARHPLVTLENHTMTHLSCAARPVEEMVDEVTRAQAILTEWTGRAPRLVAYPFGHSTEETDARLRAMGLIPVQLKPGVMTVDTFGSCRNMTYDALTQAESLARILGAWVKVKVCGP